MYYEEDYERFLSIYKIFGENNDNYKIFYDNDYPVPYKGLKIYPVKTYLYFYFHLFVQCLLQPHLSSGDINAISMSYFDYMCNKKNNEVYLNMIIILLLIVLNKPIFNKNGEINDEVLVKSTEKKGKYVLVIDNEEYNGKDFDVIKKIICEQNSVEIPDETIHPDIKKAYEEMEEYKRKQCKVKMCSFGDQINIIVAKTPYKREDVLRMTIRSFSRLLERVDKIMHYEIMTLLSPNMDDKGRKSISHYMASSDIENKYKNIMIDFNDYKNRKGL